MRCEERLSGVLHRSLGLSDPRGGTREAEEQATYRQEREQPASHSDPFRRVSSWLLT